MLFALDICQIMRQLEECNFNINAHNYNNFFFHFTKSFVFSFLSFPSTGSFKDLNTDPFRFQSVIYLVFAHFVLVFYDIQLLST